MPEILDLPVKEVQPWDHVDEGRMVIDVNWAKSDGVRITTAIVTYDDTEVGLEPVFNDVIEQLHDHDAKLRVIRGIPILGNARPDQHQQVVWHDGEGNATGPPECLGHVDDLAHPNCRADP